MLLRHNIVSRQIRARPRLFIAAAALLLALHCGAARAGVDEGIAAYQRGDYATALAEFTRAARRDDPFAQNVLGTMYAAGLGVERDYQQAASWFSRAQALGSLEATANLGRMYAEGRGVPQDSRAALQNYRDAALAGFQPAIQRMAEIYEKGELGVVPDAAAALEWRSRLHAVRPGLAERRPARSEAKAAAKAPAVDRAPAAAAASAPARASAKSADKLAAAGAAGAPVRQAAAPPKPAPEAIAVPLSESERFEREVLAQLESYSRRERTLFVSSTDQAPALAGYLGALRQRLAARLAAAMREAKARRGMTVTLSIAGDGTLRSVDLDRASGDAKLDHRVMSALRSLGAQPPLPAGAREAAELVVVTVRLPIE